MRIIGTTILYLLFCQPNKIQVGGGEIDATEKFFLCPNSVRFHCAVPITLMISTIIILMNINMIIISYSCISIYFKKCAECIVHNPFIITTDHFNF